MHSPRSKARILVSGFLRTPEEFLNSSSGVGAETVLDITALLRTTLVLRGASGPARAGGSGRQKDAGRWCRCVSGRRSGTPARGRLTGARQVSWLAGLRGFAG